MLPYFFLISIPIVFSFISVDKTSPVQKTLLFFTGAIYIFFIGLRNEVGTDWPNYIRIYDHISSSTFEDAITYTEPAYALLNWLSIQADFDIYGSNFIIAILFVSGLIKFAEKMPLPWIGLVSVTPYLVIAIGMSGVRQAAAIGIIFFLLAGWGKNSLFKNIILASIAICFHYSAVIVLVFIIQNIKMPSWFRWIILLIGGGVSFIIFAKTEQYTQYNTVYVTENLLSPGALEHISLNAIPATIYLVFMKKWNAIYGKHNLMMILSYLSLLSVAGIFISSTGIDRLSLYLSPIQMFVYSTIPVVFKTKFYSALIMVIHLIIVYIWLNYANNSNDYLPYKNILF